LAFSSRDTHPFLVGILGVCDHGGRSRAAASTGKGMQKWRPMEANSENRRNAKRLQVTDGASDGS
jgi:hypothetical protein